jgi:hypothetical protein
MQAIRDQMPLLLWQQVVALLYYMVSYFPGGTNGVMFILKMAAGAFAQCVNGTRRAVFR